MKYIQPENEHRVIDALGSLIATHAEWLDGRTFQRLTTQAAETYFPENDLDVFFSPEEFAQIAEKALEYVKQANAEDATNKTPFSVEGPLIT